MPKLRYTVAEWQALTDEERAELGEYQAYTRRGDEEPSEYRHPELMSMRDDEEIAGLKSALDKEREYRANAERELKKRGTVDIDEIAERIRAELSDELTQHRTRAEKAEKDLRVERALAKVGADPVLSSFLKEHIDADTIVDPATGDVLRDSHGDEYTLDSFIASLRDKPEYGHYFKGTVRPGTESRPPTEPRDRQQNVDYSGLRPEQRRIKESIDKARREGRVA